MNRYLKALGLALVAALALSALVSASASAQHKFRTTDKQKAHLTAVADPDKPTQVFTGNTNNIKKRFSCNKVSIEKGKGTFTDGATEITVTPKYDECVAIDEESGKEVSAFPTFNGCDYHFFGTTTAGNPTGGSHANVEIKCPAGKEIELKVTALKLACDKIPPQLLTHAVRYKNVTTEPSKITDVTVEATPHNVKNTTLPGAAGCAPEGEKVHTNGLYTGNVTVTGFKDEAHTIPTSVSAEPGT